MFGRDADSNIPGINAGSIIMSRGINKAVIVGTLGRDPEIRYSSNGNAVVNISVATNEAWKDRETGEAQE